LSSELIITTITTNPNSNLDNEAATATTAANIYRPVTKSFKIVYPSGDEEFQNSLPCIRAAFPTAQP
jgi:hypothetical protein